MNKKILLASAFTVLAVAPVVAPVVAATESAITVFSVNDAKLVEEQLAKAKAELAKVDAEVAEKLQPLYNEAAKAYKAFVDVKAAYDVAEAEYKALGVAYVEASVALNRALEAEKDMELIVKKFEALVAELKVETEGVAAEIDTLSGKIKPAAAAVENAKKAYVAAVEAREAKQLEAPVPGTSEEKVKEYNDALLVLRQTEADALKELNVKKAELADLEAQKAAKENRLTELQNRAVEAAVLYAANVRKHEEKIQAVNDANDASDKAYDAWMKKSEFLFGTNDYTDGIRSKLETATDELNKAVDKATKEYRKHNLKFSVDMIKLPSAPEKATPQVPATPPTAEAKKSGWMKENGVWFFYKEDVKATGWVKDGGKWYFLNEKGEMQTGWVKDNGTWYFLTGSGAMATGWTWDAGKWYYLKSNGAMVSNAWVKDNGTWYFLKSSGAMAVSEMTPDGYKVNASGAWVK